MTISASASTGTMRARWRRVVFLLTTVAALGLGLSVAAYSGAFGTQEAGALQTCTNIGKPGTAIENNLRAFSMRARYSDNTYVGSVKESYDHVTIYVRPRISGISQGSCNPESVHIRWKYNDVADFPEPSSACIQMNLTSSQGSTHTFTGYGSNRFSASDDSGCIYWDFWNNWPYQASISLEGRTGTARLFDSHSDLLPIKVYEAQIRICVTTADVATHVCGAWSDSLEVDLVNDSAGPSGL